MSEVKMKKVWDNCLLIDEVFKSPSTKLRVELVAREGIKYINIREWYKKKADNTWKPGLSGFAMPIMLPIDGEVDVPAANLYDVLERALLDAPNFALENEANAVWTEVKPRK